MDKATLQLVRATPLFSDLTDAQVECIEDGEIIEMPAGSVLAAGRGALRIFLHDSGRRNPVDADL